MDQLETLLSLGCFSSEIYWMEFFALGCSALGGVRHCIRPDINTNTTLYHFLWALKPNVRLSTAGDLQAVQFLFISRSCLLMFRLDPDICDPDFSIRVPRLQKEWLDKSSDLVNLCNDINLRIFLRICGPLNTFTTWGQSCSICKCVCSMGLWCSNGTWLSLNAECMFFVFFVSVFWISPTVWFSVSLYTLS